jgi:hypothetical protein
MWWRDRSLIFVSLDGFVSMFLLLFCVRASYGELGEEEQENGVTKKKNMINIGLFCDYI